MGNIQAGSLFFYDGTSRHLSCFDDLKNDEGYAGSIEENVGDMVSYHQVKRFFKFTKSYKVRFLTLQNG